MTDKPDLTRVWAVDAPSGNIIDPSATTPDKFSDGWTAEVPPFEHFNFIQKFQTQGLAHINEQGIAVWDSVTTYPIGGLAKGSDGNVYKALTSQDDNDPVSDDGTNWVDWEVTNRVIRVTSIADGMAGVVGANNSIYEVTGWHAGSKIGGGSFTFKSATAKSLHDGILYVSPTVPAISAQSGAELADRMTNFRNAVGETDVGGNGVFERNLTGVVTVAMAGALPGTAFDNSQAIMDAVTANGEAFAESFPEPYRVDYTVNVTGGNGLTLGDQAKLRRYSANSIETTPVLAVLGNYSRFSGGSLYTENDHPEGVVTLGHRDTSSTYNALNWRFTNCNVWGVQSAGNIGVRITSSQFNVGNSAANYFGTVTGIKINSADIGFQLTEIANAHIITDIQFWNCITSGLQLRGAYGNIIHGVFVHTGTNGIVGLQLLNQTIVGPHDCDSNLISGVGVEPRGAASRGLVIGSDCVRNTVTLFDNVAGGNSIGNPRNTVNLTFGACFYGSNLSMKAVNATALRLGTVSNKLPFSIGPLAENTTKEIGRVLLDYIAGGTIVTIYGNGRNRELGKTNTILAEYAINRTTGSPIVTEIRNVVSGTSYSWVTIPAPTVSAPTVSGREVIFNVKSNNNGTATTGNFIGSISINGSQSSTLTIPS